MNSSRKPHILEKHSWSKPVIQLLAHCETLTEDKSAVMWIRHSERVNIEKQSEIKKTRLTDAGKEAARGFGQLLPDKRSIFIYHSPITRCRETAECILEGATSSGIKAEILGELKILEGPNSDWDKFYENLMHDWPHSINYWLSGRYSPSMVEPSLEYSKRTSVEIENTEPGTDSNTLALYVAHDLPIMALLFHWFGVPPSLEYAGFLNGFMFQKTGSRVSLFVKDINREVELPYWWNKV
jgi:broad specificity phosphatase PhoE